MHGSTSKGKRKVVAPEPEAMLQDIDDDEEYDPSAQDPETDVKPNKKQKTKAHRGSAQTYENGVLRCLILENFMNHTHLRVDFDPHVNFIVGKNGSGKSAILNALITGFGHKASSTGKNTNKASSLIKSGTDHAVIQIHLANGGEDPYKPESFGDTIVVETHLEKSGNTYKLRDGPDGPAKRCQKRDIEELCSHLNIQAGNPCALLTQEHAKKFLHNGSEDDRYQFFLQAANMASRKVDLASAQGNIALLQERLARAEGNMSDKREVAKAAREEFEGAKQLRQLENDYNALVPLVAWAEIAQQERQAARADQAASVSLNAQAEAQQQVEKLEQEKAEKTAAYDALEREAQDLSEYSKKVADEGKQAANEIKQGRKELKRLKAEAERMAEEAVEKQREENDLARRIDEEMAGLAAKEQKLAQKQEAERQKAQKALEAAEGSRQQLHGAIGDAERSHHEAEERALATRKQVGTLEEKAAGAKQYFDQLQASAGKREARLHPDMPKLIHAISRNKSKFKSVPEGPVGLLLALDPKHTHLAEVAERACGGNKGLCSFIVSCQEDEKTLRSLLAGIKSPVSAQNSLVQNLQVHVRKQEARFNPDRLATDEPLLIDVVTTKSDAVFNLVCDQFKGAKTLLFNDLERAKKEVFVKCRAANAQAYTTAKPGDLSHAFFVAVKGFRKGKQGTEVIESLKARVTGCFDEDGSAALKQSGDLAAQAAKELADAKAEFKVAADERKKAFAAEAKAKTDLKEADKRVRKLQHELSAMEELNVDDASQELDELNGQARSVTKERMAAAKLSADAQRDHRRLEAVLEPKIADATAVQAKFNEMKEMWLEKSKEVEGLKKPLVKNGAMLRQACKAAHEAGQNAAVEQQEAQKIKVYIAKMAPQIEAAYGPRVDDEEQRSVDDLQKAMVRLESKKNHAKKKHGGRDIDELRERAAKAEEHFRKAMENIETVKRTGEEEEAAFNRRYKFFVKETKQKGKQATLDFNQRLSMKGHAGELHFNHADERLGLTVERNSQDTRGGSSTTDARSLSGGERSFTTLSFELAMWEFCATPFRALDEFDVYMDDTYRKIAVDTLMELCDSQKERQFLFITPQDMHPFLANRKQIPNIIKMKNVR